ncbi:hypothetical protein GCM10009865_50690 [Aeromicrobium ponti]|uniref:Lipoprotein n=1 Tax=Cytobacillus oceanisediminis TaxID=665099 RepID=A0A562J7W8_9BACI|nr:hypothetical protein [Cytobacillus oceanisediminis]TWH79259.1 hypothetical protein IQ19_05006 [Cytobacillus oceanisediminis]
MNKRLGFSVILILLLSLAACGETQVENKEVGSVDSTENSNEAEETGEETPETDKKEFNQQIVDNENIKATLVSVEKIVNKEWDEERIEVTFEVENKRQDTIDVQAREVSADGKMIDESMLSMSQEISGGKKADAVLTIQNYEGDLPAMEENLEMILHVFSWDDMEWSEDHKVKIDFK